MPVRLRFAGLLGIALVLCAPLLRAQASPPAAPAVQTTPAFSGQISGAVHAGNVPLPGVAISATNSASGQKILTSTDAAGKFVIAVPSQGRYLVRAEMAAFAPATKELTITPETPNGALDFELQLQSRVQAAQQQQQAQRQAQMRQLAAARAGGGFQSLDVNAGDAAALMADAGMNGGGAAPGTPAMQNSADPAMPSLPQAGLADNAATESVLVSGQMGQTENMGPDVDQIRERMEEYRAQGGGGGDGGAMLNGGPGGGFGGRGGFGGGPGAMMGGGPGGGRGGFGNFGRFNVNRPHGSVFYSLNDGALNAAPYALNGIGVSRPGYAQHRFGAMIGGPLNIPKIYKGGDKTFFTLNYSGTRAANPYDVYSNVPTAEQRVGNFSALPTQLVDPSTGQAFAGNQIPSSMINSASAGLLKYVPLPNIAGPQNFHYATTSDNSNDSFNVRIIHNFGAPPPQRGGAQRGPRGPRGPGQRGGGRRGARNNLNIGFSISNNHGDVLKPFPSITGATSSRGINVPIGYVRSFGRLVSNSRFNFNRSRTQVASAFSGVNNVVGSLGINGVSQNPFDFGVPSISLTHFTGLSDVNPVLNRNQTFSFSEGLVYARGKHNWRFGGDFRRIQVNPRTDPNARGTFVFTGFASGYDLADFLLGVPQQTSTQYGVNSYYFRGNSWDAYLQDDWRLRGNLTLNLGLRYEYVSPFSEKYNRIVNLDANPLFTVVAPVTPGARGPITGAFPQTLVDPDRNNVAPRVGIAWKPFGNTVVRSGYGINYNTGAYGSMVQQMAFQPPFTFTQTNIASSPASLTLQNGFPPAPPNTITNNYGVDRNYRLGYVQTWNLGVQHELTKTIVLNVDYYGSKGTDLDIVRAPNRNAGGVRIANAQPFLWLSSVGDSTLHSGNVRVRKRMQHGVSVGGTYTFAKSIDNASSIGGSGTVVAQNDQDLRAERGLSSFDVRQRLTADYLVELPFGTNKRWLAGPGFFPKVLGDWTWSGNLSAQTGSPFTARIVGAIADVARGTNGTLRANYTGVPVECSASSPCLVNGVAYDHPTLQAWFNPAAFVAPAPGQFGDTRRNIIEGPGGIQLNMSLAKNFPIHDVQGMEFRISANNVFNTPRFTSIDTSLNSPTFGRVIGVGGMRQVTLSARYRF